MKKSILAISILLSTSVMADYKVIMSGKSGNIQLPKQSAPSFSAHTFTNCGQTGRFGPSQSNCISEYNGSEILSPELSFSVTNGIQSFTIPFDGNYKIEAWGAQGGSVGGYSGGKGAKAEKIVNLNNGDEINVIIGQIGTSGGNGSGGGGGSYVVRNKTTPLVIAGGGGGATSHYGTNGYPGLASTSGGDSSVNGYSCQGGGLGGENGTGGTGGCASGGAGWLQNGYPGYGNHNAQGGVKFSDGGQGGTSSHADEKPHGGFGGGGAGSPNYGYGGGGGGYSGGGGGSWNNPQTGNGGGGGSLGDNNVTGVNSGHGSVTITLIE